MSVSSIGSGSSCASYVSNKPALSYNHQQAVQENNQKTGANYSIDVEKSASNAQLIVNLFA